MLYAAGNRVFRSIDEGTTWEAVSPDLTRNDPSKGEPGGGPISRDVSGSEVYCTVFSFAESPHEPGVFWAGSDDGLVHVSRDGGDSWYEVTPPGLPKWATVSMIELSPHDPGHGLARGLELQARRLLSLPLPDAGRRQDLGLDSREEYRVGSSCASSAKIRRARACSTPVRRRASTCPRTLGSRGSRSS